MKKLNVLNLKVNVDGLEVAKICSENVLASMNIGAVDNQEDNFGLEDLEAIITDLQESYYKLNKGSIQLKIAISQEIRELVMLRSDLERSCSFL